MNPLNSVRGAITTGVVLALIILLVVLTPTTDSIELGLARWLHILSGVMWIGLLYYFNVVQIPALARRRGRQGWPRRRRHHQVHRAARAVLVPLGGTGHLAHGCLVPAARPGTSSGRSRSARHRSTNYYQLVIGIGAWLGTIMLFNVWVLIWPNQKKILGIVPATDEEKADGAQGRDAWPRAQLRALDPDAAVHGGPRRTACRSDESAAELLTTTRLRPGFFSVRVARCLAPPLTSRAPGRPRRSPRTSAAAI